jgi:hypothetical protein
MEKWYKLGNITMNKKVLVILVILFLVLLGIGAYFFLIKGAPKNQLETQDQKQPAGQSNTGNKTESIEATLKSLLTAGKSLRCTFSNNTKEVSVSGTVYTAGGKVREDFQSNAAGSTMSGHLIVDNLNSYMWTEGSNQGFKFAVDKAASTSSGSAQSQTQDINKAMNFSCQGWSVDNSLFVLPTNVTFQSFAIPVISPSSGKSSTGSAVNTPKSACPACDNLPAGEARNACRTQLDC